MASDMAAKMCAASETLIMAFDGEWSAEASVATRAPECEHTTLPASSGFPKRNNDEFVVHIKRVGPLMQEAKMTINDSIVVPSERRAVYVSTMNATTPVGPFTNEYVWFFTFDESGGKIVKITEFLDTKASADIVARLVEAGVYKRH